MRRDNVGSTNIVVVETTVVLMVIEDQIDCLVDVMVALHVS